MRATPDFDFGLTESAQMIREAAGRFADEQILPLAAAIDREDRFPRELWEPMGSLGLHGITVEEEWGGLGLGYLDHVIAVEEVSRASGAVGLSYGAHSNLCINQLRRWGNDEQKAKYLPGLISGVHVGSLAMSEVGAGSDVVSMKLKADPVAGGFRLNGTKFWITNGTCADTLVVYAKSAPDAGSRGITAFLIEKDMPGFSIGQKIDKMGLRGSPTCELVFDDCFVPEENVMGPLHGGVGVLMSGLDYERVVLAGMQIGIIQACLDVVIPYVRERKQFGKPIGSFQALQHRAVDMLIQQELSGALVAQALAELDRGCTGSERALLAARVKSRCSEAALTIARESVQLHGAIGVTDDCDLGLYVQRALVLSAWLGNAGVQRRRYAALSRNDARQPGAPE